MGDFRVSWLQRLSVFIRYKASCAHSGIAVCAAERGDLSFSFWCTSFFLFFALIVKQKAQSLDIDYRVRVAKRLKRNSSSWSSWWVLAWRLAWSCTAYVTPLQHILRLFLEAVGIQFCQKKCKHEADRQFCNSKDWYLVALFVNTRIILGNDH